MALALGVHTSAHAEVASSVTSSAITITAGSLIVIGTLNYDGGSTQTTSVSGSVDGAAALIERAAVAGNRWSELWYIKNSAGGSQTFTFTVLSSDYPRIFVLEFTGADTSAPLDQHTSHTVQSTDTDTTTGVTTTLANEVLVGVGGDDNNADVQTFSDGGCANASGFSGNGTETQDATGNGLSGAMTYSIVSSTGTYCASMTATGASTAVKTMTLGTFKASSGVVAAIPNRIYQKNQAVQRAAVY